MDSRNSDSRRSSSSSSTSGVKSKWIKAFRSLKLTTVGSSRNEVASRESHSAMRISAHLGVHAFQEYTYKKITACDVCREILRGHARQGLKCKLCKMNVHSGSCQENAPKCQPKPRLLRKQKSASELETKITIPQIEDERPGSNLYDPMYQSLRAAADARRCAQYVSDGYMASHDNENGPMAKNDCRRADSSNEGSNISLAAMSTTNINNGHSMGSGEEFHHYPTMQQPPPPPQQPHLRYNQHYGGNPEPQCGQQQQQQPPLRAHIKQNSPALLSIAATSHQAYSAPHSPQKKKLTLRMKSLSLDSPESAETLKEKRPSGFYPSSTSTVHTPPFEPPPVEMTNYKYKAAPPNQSPAMPKRFKLGMHGRMCSIESDPMGDLSSSLSPCPSPKPQRLLPANIFVVLYNFRSRQVDELNLRAGYMVTVVDTTDPDWWQGKCLGTNQVGFFPSKCLTKLFPGERPLQVIHTVQVNDGEFATKLIREQIVIQVSDELNGIVPVRTGLNDKIVPCPSKYLQEITL